MVKDANRRIKPYKDFRLKLNRSKKLNLRTLTREFDKNRLIEEIEGKLKLAKGFKIETVGKSKWKRLSKKAGIYIAYWKKKPFYVGETADLRKRIKYHTGCSEDSRRNSTLRKRLAGRKMRNVSFRTLELEIGRKEVESLLSEEWNIKKRRRKKKKEKER